LQPALDLDGDETGSTGTGGEAMAKVADLLFVAIRPGVGA
jgi:hypothetical protein